MPVHLYGQPADLDPILTFARDHALVVVEDCAQAHGARSGDRLVGTLGDLAAFSFYPTKNLGAMGDGGAVVTNNAAFAEQLRLLRQYGWRERYISDVAGWNSRLDELQAAVLSVRLQLLDRENATRRRLAAHYDGLLADLPLTTPAQRPGDSHVFHLYVIETERRDALQAHLAALGIGTGIHYPMPIHLQPAYRRLGSGPGSLPVTEAAAGRILSLPMHPYLTEADVQRVADAIARFFGG